MVEISGYFSVPLEFHGIKIWADVDIECGDIRHVTDVYVEQNGAKVASIPFEESDFINDLEDGIKDTVERMYFDGAFEDEAPWEEEK